MIKLQPFKTAMPARAGAIAWEAAAIRFDCVGRRSAYFHGALGREEGIARQMRNRAFRVANRTPLLNAKEAEMLRRLEDQMVEAREQDRIFEREMLYSPARRCGKSATATEMLSRPEAILFVGGPENGKYHDVPRDLYFYRVAERKPVRFFSPGTADLIYEPFKTYTYERRISQASEFMAFVE